jgi:chitinase
VVIGSQYRIGVAVLGPFNTADTDLSAPFLLLGVAPCVTDVAVNPTSVQQGSAQTVSWSTNSQQSYSLYLFNGTGTARVDMTPWGGGADGWIETGGAAARSADWYAPWTLPPGTYRVKVKVTATNGVAGSALSSPFSVLPTPIVGSVTLGSTRPQTGSALTVSWASTNQEKYAVYDCDGSGRCPDTWFLSGANQKSVVGPIPLDRPAGGNRKLQVRVWSSSGASNAALSATYSTIHAYVSFRSMDTIVDEGNTQVVPEVMLRTSDGGPTTAPITLTRSTLDGSATAPGDYAASSESATIPSGIASNGFAPLPAVAIREDTLYERGESFSLSLADVTAASLDDTRPQHMTHKVVIVDDDPVPRLTIGDVVVEEPDAGPVDAQFLVTLSAVSGLPVSVEYATSDVTAAAGDDYTAAAGTLTIPAGSSRGTVRVPVLPDAEPESTETFALGLSGPVNATLADTRFEAAILDPVRISIGDVSLAEGDSGPSEATFTVSLSKPHPQALTIAYATADASAEAGADYRAASGTLTFPPGSVSETIAVTVDGDTLFELDETFRLDLSGAPAGTRLLDAQGVARIANDDAPPALSIGDAAVIEGPAGSTATASFFVSLSAPAGTPVMVRYATADGTATAGADYTARGGTLTIPAGLVAATLSVTVRGDGSVEPDETFTVTLEGPGPAVVPLARAQATGVITTDDFGLSIADAAVGEGDEGATDAVFAVSLTSPAPEAVSVRYATAARTAAAGSDYTTTSGTLTFPPGETTQEVSVLVQGDTLHEADETFAVTLSAPTGGGVLVDASAVGTITNDDAAPSLSIGDAAVTEVDPGANVSAVFTVTLSEPSGQPITVDYATANGSAVAPGDFTAKAGTLTFAAGTTSRTIAVAVVGDNVVEGDESFFVNLSNPDPAGVVLADGRGVGTVTTDDFGLSIDDVTVAEGDAGTSDAAFTVTLSSPRSSLVTVRYATANGTAVAGSDYAAGSGTLTFAPGETAKTLAVPVLGGYSLRMLCPRGAAMARPRGR